MRQSEFIDHLARKGVLRDPQGLDGFATARRREVFGDLDWVGMTKLSQAAFADELADFYRCNRVERGGFGRHRAGGLDGERKGRGNPALSLAEKTLDRHPAPTAADASGENLVDAAGIHIDDLEAPAFRIETFSDFRKIAEPVEHEARGGMKRPVRRQGDREPLGHLVDRHASGNQP
jgi:hypothetical protein